MEASVVGKRWLSRESVEGDYSHHTLSQTSPAADDHNVASTGHPARNNMQPVKRYILSGRQGKRFSVQVKPTDKVPEDVGLFSPVEYRDAFHVPISIPRLGHKVLLDILNVEANTTSGGDEKQKDGAKEGGDDRNGMGRKERRWADLRQLSEPVVATVPKRTNGGNGLRQNKERVSEGLGEKEVAVVGSSKGLGDYQAAIAGQVVSRQAVPTNSAQVTSYRPAPASSGQEVFHQLAPVSSGQEISHRPAPTSSARVISHQSAPASSNCIMASQQPIAATSSHMMESHHQIPTTSAYLTPSVPAIALPSNVIAKSSSDMMMQTAPQQNGFMTPPTSANVQAIAENAQSAPVSSVPNTAAKVAPKHITQRVPVTLKVDQKKIDLYVTDLLVRGLRKRGVGEAPEEGKNFIECMVNEFGNVIRMGQTQSNVNAHAPTIAPTTATGIAPVVQQIRSPQIAKKKQKSPSLVPVSPKVSKDAQPTKETDYDATLGPFKKLAKRFEDGEKLQTKEANAIIKRLKMKVNSEERYSVIRGLYYLSKLPNDSNAPLRHVSDKHPAMVLLMAEVASFQLYIKAFMDALKAEKAGSDRHKAALDHLVMAYALLACFPYKGVQTMSKEITSKLNTASPHAAVSADKRKSLEALIRLTKKAVKTKCADLKIRESVFEKRLKSNLASFFRGYKRFTASFFDEVNAVTTAPEKPKDTVLQKRVALKSAKPTAPAKKRPRVAEGDVDRSMNGAAARPSKIDAVASDSVNGADAKNSTQLSSSAAVVRSQSSPKVLPFTGKESSAAMKEMKRSMEETAQSTAEMSIPKERMLPLVSKNELQNGQITRGRADARSTYHSLLPNSTWSKDKVPIKGVYQNSVKLYPYALPQNSTGQFNKGSVYDIILPDDNVAQADRANGERAPHGVIRTVLNDRPAAEYKLGPDKTPTKLLIRQSGAGKSVDFKKGNQKQGSDAIERHIEERASYVPYWFWPPNDQQGLAKGREGDGLSKANEGGAEEAPYPLEYGDVLKGTVLDSHVMRYGKAHDPKTQARAKSDVSIIRSKMKEEMLRRIELLSPKSTLLLFAHLLHGSRRRSVPKEDNHEVILESLPARMKRLIDREQLLA